MLFACGHSGPNFVYAWPNARWGGDEPRLGHEGEDAFKMKNNEEEEEDDDDDDDEKSVFHDAWYASSRLWADEIIDPRMTRKTLIRSLQVVKRKRGGLLDSVSQSTKYPVLRL